VSESNAAGNGHRPETYWDGGGEGNFEEGFSRGMGMVPGGSPEALPEMLEDEVEIVLIRSRSTLGDLMSLRARRVDGRIRYRMVDEYEMSVDLAVPQDENPLAFGELTEVLWSFRMSKLDDPFFLMCWVNCLDALEYLGWDGIREFHLVTSEFYDGLEDWYDERFQEWAAAEQASRAEDEKEWDEG